MYLAVCASGAADVVGIAQLVERRVVVADVAGSSPVTHPDQKAPGPLHTTDTGPSSCRLTGCGLGGCRVHAR